MLRSSTGAAPPGSDSPFPGTFNVHSGAFSLKSRLADAYSDRTLLQSHCSSSATIIALQVKTPVPISVCPIRMVTVSSGAIVIHALISGTVASRYHGCATTGVPAAFTVSRSTEKPSTIPPPTTAAVVRNSRRSMSTVPSRSSSLSGLFVFMSCSPRAQMVKTPLRAHAGGAMNRLADAMVRPTPARVRDLRVDVRVGRLRRLLQQRDRRQDHPRLAVAALRHVELLPRELDRVRPVGRQAFDGRDRRAGRAAHRQQTRARRHALDQHRA